MLDICLLGCGGMLPLENRWLTSLLVRHNGKMVLIDCGEGTQIPLKLAGWGLKNIDALCLTHYHADHVAGLPGFLLTLGNSGRTEPLTIMGPPGIEAVIKGLTVIAPKLPYSFNLIELPQDYNQTQIIGGMIIHSTPADHSLPCLSYAIEIKRTGLFDPRKAKANKVPISFWSKLQKGETLEKGEEIFTPNMVLGEPRKGLKVSYCTDTRPSDTLVEFIKDSDLLICEGMYGDDSQLQKAMDKKHMLFSEAATLAQNSHVKELWLTHFSPAMDKPENYLENAKIIFQNTILGNNLLSKAMSFEKKQ